MAKVLILAKTGFGKTTSIFNIPKLGIKGLDPKETFIISCTSKPLSTYNSRNVYKEVNYDALKSLGKFQVTPTDENRRKLLHNQILNTIKGHNRLIARDALDVVYTLDVINTYSKSIKNIIIDDLNYISQDAYMRDALKGGWDTPKKIGYNMGLIFDTIDTIRTDINIVCMAHFEEYKDKTADSISYRYKSVGNMVDTYITPEGKFETVLYGQSYFDGAEKKSIRQFVTNDDGTYPAKSPFGMFQELYIPNDLGYVLERAMAYENGLLDEEFNIVPPVNNTSES